MTRPLSGRLPMQTPKSSEVLELCHQLFPGLNWVILQDSDDLAMQYQDYSAKIQQWGLCFELLIQDNGSSAQFGFYRLQLMRSLNEEHQTYQQALTDLHSAWIKYCEAMASASQQPKL